ncbi:hypothetical protein ACPOL_6330 [Acidisarcina polymorpha]|uniref:Uncharacterized protein n=1 Tax=Acidisarcina polymorpha TaxID=2211140 RepID=A0A2Z5GA32_9BACT|nr:hypothetical protein ACPOL_6330 [Acidisarcina polymorpha]
MSLTSIYEHANEVLQDADIQQSEMADGSNSHRYRSDNGHPDTSV